MEGVSQAIIRNFPGLCQTGSNLTAVVADKAFLNQVVNLVVGNGITLAGIQGLGSVAVA